VCALQEIADSVALRQRIQNQFELAALPGTSEEDMRTTLHFVVVGGGPTGANTLGCAVVLRLALSETCAFIHQGRTWL
jgi:NADH dehydrogenase FAD-containing subunit